MIPEGWKLVPIEPTEDMMMEGMVHINDGDQSDIEFPTLYPTEFWKAALAAAPTFPSLPGPLVVKEVTVPCLHCGTVTTVKVTQDV